jgi:hypothetical protein
MHKLLIKFLLIFLGIILFLYIAHRSIYLSFVHDESQTFKGLAGLCNFENSANNHLLNSILMTFSRKIIGNQEWSLRLPNVLSFLLYFMGIYFLIRKEKKLSLILLFIGIVFLNPFLLDFFSLARGYGISLGFLSLSLLYLLKQNIKATTNKSFNLHYCKVLLFGNLAVMANFVLLNYLISAMIINFFLFYKQFA